MIRATQATNERDETMNATQQHISSNRARDFRGVIEHLTPTTLAALSVELESADRLLRAADTFLDLVNTALVANVGEGEAEQLRMWVRENI